MSTEVLFDQEPHYRPLQSLRAKMAVGGLFKGRPFVCGGCYKCLGENPGAESRCFYLDDNTTLVNMEETRAEPHGLQIDERTFLVTGGKSFNSDQCSSEFIHVEVEVRQLCELMHIPVGHSDQSSQKQGPELRAELR